MGVCPPNGVAWDISNHISIMFNSEKGMNCLQ